MTFLGGRELRVQARERGCFDPRGEQAEAFVRARLDEAQEKQSIRETTSIRSCESEERTGIGVAPVAAEPSPSFYDVLVDRAKVLELFNGEGAQAPHELGVLGIGRNEGHRRGRGLLLAMSVVDEDGVHIRDRDLDPIGRRIGNEHVAL